MYRYILAIKALRELDPSGVILEVVCRPVRAYLQLRDDTVRSIVRSLVDDSSSELSNELAEGKPIEIPDSDMSTCAQSHLCVHARLKLLVLVLNVTLCRFCPRALILWSLTNHPQL